MPDSNKPTTQLGRIEYKCREANEKLDRLEAAMKSLAAQNRGLETTLAAQLADVLRRLQAFAPVVP